MGEGGAQPSPLVWRAVWTSPVAGAPPGERLPCSGPVLPCLLPTVNRQPTFAVVFHQDPDTKCTKIIFMSLDSHIFESTYILSLYTLPPPVFHHLSPTSHFSSLKPLPATLRSLEGGQARQPRTAHGHLLPGLRTRR